MYVFIILSLQSLQISSEQLYGFGNGARGSWKVYVQFKVNQNEEMLIQ